MAAFYWLVIEVTSLASPVTATTRHLVILAFGVANLTLPTAILALRWLDRGPSDVTLLNVLRLVKFVGIFVLLAAVAARVGQSQRLSIISAVLFAAVALLDLISVSVLLSFQQRSAARPGRDTDTRQ